MFIDELRLENFRNFPVLFFKPSLNLNIIFGKNGAGKSTILESIFLLSFGRSFRTSKLDTLVRHDAIQATAFCHFSQNGSYRRLGFTRVKNKQNTFSLDGNKQKRLSDISRIIPVQIFTPQSSDLIIGAPLGRRRYIDWLLFHVEHDFNYLSKTYAQALQQRNALLKQFEYDQLVEFNTQDVWLKTIVECGEKISEKRTHYVNQINSEINDLFSHFYPEFKLSMRYNQGWDNTSTLEQVLKAKVQRDLYRGSTGYGPHKADIQFVVSGQDASEVLSRGQLRLLVSVLLLAEVKLLNKLKNKTTIFLIDDISAELDIEKREKFVDMILEQKSQVFITAIEKQQIQFIDKYKNKKTFHVKHNNVNEE